MTSTLPSELRKKRTIEATIGQCLNHACLHLNLESTQRCQRCGSKLLLKERYRAIRYLGSGGFASTFEAVDEHRLETTCLIKQFLPREPNKELRKGLKKLFEQEAEILTRVGTHPQIPTLLAFFEQESRAYIIQEFIDGRDLFSELRDRGAFLEQQIWQLLASLLPVLQYIHEQKVIHTDIKLGNIIRQRDGSLALIDFGSSQKSDVNRLRTNMPITATPGYAAPEQIEGRVYPASDLYSLGVTAIRLLTGCLPAADGSEPLFDARTQQWLWRETGVFISPKLAVILDRLVQPDLKDRYQSAAEVLEALQASSFETETEPVASHLFLSFGSKLDSNYQSLQDLLAARQYQQADGETWKLLLHLTDRTNEGFLNLKALKSLATSDLDAIDRLWRKFSDDRFGFSVQKQIYQQLGGSKKFDYQIWQKFGELVGWSESGIWLNYADLKDRGNTPKGHFPACFADALNRSGVERGVCGWWRLGFVWLIQKIGNE
jgi:serine/threonine protein kinase